MCVGCSESLHSFSQPRLLAMGGVPDSAHIPTGSINSLEKLFNVVILFVARLHTSNGTNHIL